MLDQVYTQAAHMLQRQRYREDLNIHKLDGVVVERKMDSGQQRLIAL